MPVHFRGAAAVVAFFLYAAYAGDCLAANVEKACLEQAQLLGKNEISSFLAEPGKLLATYPDAGIPLSNQVRSLAATDERTVDAIMGLKQAASGKQRAAIAAGLARTVSVCGQAKPDYAARIQTVIAQSGDKEMQIAFQQASDDIKVAAVQNAAGASLLGGGAVTPSGADPKGQNSLRFSDAPTKVTSGVYTLGNAGSYLDQGNVSAE